MIWVVGNFLVVFAEKTEERDRKEGKFLEYMPYWPESWHDAQSES
jgi:hypothetical protein